MLPIHQILFYVFSAVLVVSALMMILSRNPVRAVLFLVLCFVASSVLWIMIQAEFLGLVLIFVYVGAVMTLFLFVVMMLNADVAALKAGFVKFLPIGIVVMVLFFSVLWVGIDFSKAFFAHAGITPHSSSFSNVKAVGQLMFTKYLFELEVAGGILLVAMISAICLAFYGRKPGTKTQNISKQLNIKREERVRIVKGMK